MKKILSLILTAAMLCGLFAVGTGAEASATDVIDALDFVMNDYLWLAEWCGGYFPVDGAPSADAVDQCFKWNVESEYEEYMVSMDEYGFAKYEIPADVYENELVSTVFAKTDALIEKLHAADFYKTDKDIPYYFIEVGGGFGDYLPTVVAQGYNVREDGLIEAYAYLAEYLVDGENYEMVEYVPADDEVEGEDYIIIGITTYDYDETSETYKEGFKYAPAKISGAVCSVMSLDVEEWTAVYYSYENIDTADIPAAEDMITAEGTADVAYVGGAFMEIDRTTFDEGTVVYGEEFWDDPEIDGEEFDTLADLLKDHGELGGLYDITAMKDGETVQPNKPVPVSFILPYDFSPDSTVYYIAEDGEVTALETAIDPDSYDPTTLYATAELEHFSRYAVAGYRYGDANKDSSVNLTDVSTMLKKIASWDVELSEITTDANRDGKVNLTDVSLVLKYIAGWDVWFGADYIPEEPTPEIPEVPGMEIDEDGVLVKYTGTDTEVVIPEGVTAIGDEAFRDCENVVSVCLPSGVRSIGNYAFAYCANLEEITISDDVESIGMYAFASCNKIAELTVPDSVTSIEMCAFQQCALLSEVKLPAGLASVEYRLFYGCSNLKRVVVPPSVKTIGDEAFMSCGNLSEVSMSNGLESIGVQAFYNCDGLIEIDIPDSVTNIDKCTFMDCSNLETVKLPANLKAVEHGLFGLCDNLKNVVVPDGVTSIEAWTFKYCKKLEKVMIPKSVTAIADGAFDGSPNVVIWCPEGSFADEYTLKNKITSHPYSE